MTGQQQPYTKGCRRCALPCARRMGELDDCPCKAKPQLIVAFQEPFSQCFQGQTQTHDSSTQHGLSHMVATASGSGDFLFRCSLLLQWGSNPFLLDPHVVALCRCFSELNDDTYHVADEVLQPPVASTGNAAGQQWHAVVTVLHFALRLL